MRTRLSNTINPLCMIMMSVAFFGCAPEGEEINTKPNIGSFNPPQSIPAQAYMNLVPNDPGHGGSQPEAQETSDDTNGQGSTESTDPLKLHTNTPNPFNPATKFSFSVPKDGSSVVLAIHSVDGRRTRQLVDTILPGGEHSITWRGRDDDGRKLPSGVYFACLQAGGEVRVRKVVMVQ